MPDETPPAADEEKQTTTEKQTAAVERRAAVPGLATANGHAVVIAQPPPPAGMAMPQVSRRGVLRVAFWTGLGAMLLGITSTTIYSLWPRAVAGFGGRIFVGTVDQIDPGQKLHNLEARAWIVRFDAEQAERNGTEEGAILALWHKCPHLGCTVPYRENFSFEDPRIGSSYSGWFRCPCHGSTYSDAGVRVFGPAPRSMDVFEMSIDGGNIVVNTGAITPGDEANGSRAIQPT
jgi:cytochrome b6-f complex iron-sulfur subunit